MLGMKLEVGLSWGGILLCYRSAVPLIDRIWNKYFIKVESLKLFIYNNKDKLLIECDSLRQQVCPGSLCVVICRVVSSYKVDCNYMVS